MSDTRLIIEASQWFITFGIPILFLVYPRIPRWPKSYGQRIYCAVLGVWALMIVHRMMALPYILTEAHAAGNTTYDGVGGNVLVLFMGWGFGFVGCIPAMLIHSIIHHPRSPEEVPE